MSTWANQNKPSQPDRTHNTHSERIQRIQHTGTEIKIVETVSYQKQCHMRGGGGGAAMRALANQNRPSQTCSTYNTHSERVQGMRHAGVHSIAGTRNNAALRVGEEATSMFANQSKPSQADSAYNKQASAYRAYDTYNTQT